MIEITNLEFSYPSGDFRLSIPDLNIASGEMVAFIGPSGSGKTTLLNLIAGIVAPERGTVSCGDVLVGSLPDRQRREFRASNIGMVFQEFELLEYLTVRDNILLPYRITPALELTDSVRIRAGELAEQVGLGDKIDRYPDELSQGERQRIAVCRSVLPQPGLLLADEPTGNLDPANKTKVLEVLFAFAREQGSTLIAVTHDHDLLGHFDRAIDFKEFQLLTEAAP
jgi:putative ABC transport system ATP-binding protein